jgi:hypothetical protein
VTHLFTVLFFAGMLGMAVAILWSVIDENRDAVLANMPWKPRHAAPQPRVIVRKVPGRSAARRQAYWATPSISSDTPSRARTVSPATVL